jgi:hypothetical protein
MWPLEPTKFHPAPTMSLQHTFRTYPMLSQGHRSQQIPTQAFPSHLQCSLYLQHISWVTAHDKISSSIVPITTPVNQSPAQPIQWSSIMPVGTGANLFRVVHPGPSHLSTRTRTSKEPKNSSVCQFWTKQEHCSGQPYSSNGQYGIQCS